MIFILITYENKDKNDGKEDRQMIKLIATDVDGTLVADGSGSLNPEYFPVIEQLIAQGIQFVVASGRTKSSISSLMKPIVDKITMIAEGGAYVCTWKEDLLFYPIPMDVVRELIRDIRSLTNCEIMISSPKQCYVETEDTDFIQWIEQDYGFCVKQVKDLLEIEDKIVKVSLYHKINAGKETEKGLKEKWESRLHLAEAGHEWVDCIMPQTNKGVALAYLQEKYGVTKDETMVFGDNFNDLEMLEQATFSFAVENARKEVKERANYIADTNMNHGVLQILKQVVDRKGIYNGR